MSANAAKIAELKSIVDDSIKIIETSEDSFERSEAQNLADDALSELERLQAIELGLVRGPNRIQSAIEEATSEGSVSRSALNLGADVLGGAIKGVAGIASLPYELPALMAAGAESAAEKMGYDYDTPDWLRQGRFYEFLAGEWAHRNPQSQIGIALENLGEAGAEMSPALMGGPFVYGAAVTAELTRKQLADTVRPYGKAGEYTAMAVESVPIGGPEFAAVAATVPFKKATPQMPSQKKISKQKREQLGPVGREELTTAQEAGFELTVGQTSGDKAQLALENVLRNSPEGGVLIDLDVRNANRVPQFILKAYDLVKNPKLSGVELRTALTNAYEGYKKGRQASFKKQTSDKFNALPDDVTFDISPILAKIDELKAKYVLDEDTVDTNSVVKALDRLKKGLTDVETRTVIEYVRDNKGIRRAVKREIEVPGGARQLTPQQIQKHLQDIGEMAFQGTNAKFADVSPGFTRAIGKELGISFKEIIDSAAGQGDAAAVALKDARDFYNTQLADMKVWGDIPFITFMDKTPSSISASEIISVVKNVGDLEIPIVRELLNKERPDLIPQIQKSLIEDLVAKHQTLETRGSGIEGQRSINVRGLLDDLSEMQQNNYWFNDGASTKAIKDLQSILPTVERTLAQQGVPAVAKQPLIPQLARMNSEIQGVLFGTPGRYTAQVGERMADTVVTIMSDPRALAQAAVTPDLVPAVRKALRKQKLDKKELKKIYAWQAAYRLQLLDDIREEGERVQEEAGVTGP